MLIVRVADNGGLDAGQFLAQLWQEQEDFNSLTVFTTSEEHKNKQFNTVPSILVHFNLLGGKKEQKKEPKKHR